MLTLSLTRLSYPVNAAQASDYRHQTRLGLAAVDGYPRWCLKGVITCTPPADPWSEPTEPNPMYGRASVPVPPSPLREPTAELPPILAPRRGDPARAGGVLAEGEEVLPPAGVGRMGLHRGRPDPHLHRLGRLGGRRAWLGHVARGPGLLLALVAAAGIFVLARLLGYLVLERTMGRGAPACPVVAFSSLGCS